MLTSVEVSPRVFHLGLAHTPGSRSQLVLYNAHSVEVKRMDVAAYSPQQLEQRLEFYGFPRLPGDPCERQPTRPTSVAGGVARRVIARPETEQQEGGETEEGGEERIEHVPASLVDHAEVNAPPCTASVHSCRPPRLTTAAVASSVVTRRRLSICRRQLTATLLTDTHLGFDHAGTRRRRARWWQSTCMRRTARV